jgi:hypothetical protein
MVYHGDRASIMKAIGIFKVIGYREYLLDDLSRIKRVIKEDG